MRTNSCRSRLLQLAFTFIALFAAFVSHGTPTTTQQFVLQPGWNAIWVELDPVDPSPAAVFSGLPADRLESVWGWSTRQTTVDYISDSGEAPWNRDSMLMFLPATRPEAFQNNLNAIQACRAYVVKIAAGSPLTLTITGTPSFAYPAWVPNVYNMRGFPVTGEANQPTFKDFFSSSPAHYDSTASRLENIYKLNPNGSWTLVPATEVVVQGAAYWVYCRGASSYVAPFEASAPQSAGFEFGLTGKEIGLALQNRRSTAASALIAGLNIGSGAFSEVTLSATADLVYTTVTGSLTRAVPASDLLALSYQINRDKLPSDSFESIVTVTDGKGIRFRIPLSAQRITPGSASDPAVREAKMHAGLWVGIATLDAVSEAHSTTITTNYVTDDAGLTHPELVRLTTDPTPKPVASPLNMKLLLHVDTNGVTRLLKEVVVMFASGVYTNDTDGVGELAQPGHYVLVTDDSLLAQFNGAAVIDGKSVGRRLSTVDYDFASTSAANFLAMSGSFAVSNTLTASIVLSSSFPTNPFRHKFHPDHDELGPDFKTAALHPEVYEITRTIALSPTATDPSGTTPPGYGDVQLSGTYQETIQGLHKALIVTSGTFTLRRVNQIGVLNQ